MEIIIDNREQKCLEFDHPYVTGVSYETISCGDYGVRFKNGYVPPLFFERKSISDLYGTMGKGYPRFKKELSRAKENDLRLILIIEGTLTKIFKGYKHSTIKGISLIRKLFTLWIKYDLLPVFCRDRAEMSNFICEYYGAIGRKALADLKEQKNVD